jgi:nicotinate-nucleotide pyrophosphorylase (carboxylating)
MYESPQVKTLIRAALEEDLGLGDITCALTIPAGHRSRAAVVARERLVFCGAGIMPALFSEMGCEVQLVLGAKEGDEFEADTVLAELSGETRHLLAAERTLLNFLQRLSGVATCARRFVKAAGAITVLDTRKTTPGWRVLEKHAVKVGGARNHRFSLGDMILIKNNHIAAHGGDLKAVMREVAARKPFYMLVEVEVRSCAELEQALKLGADIVMLDNMNDEELRRAAALAKSIAPDVPVEVSGGVTIERLRELSALGVSCVSVGALTTHAVNVDISMRIKAESVRAGAEG